MSPGVYWKYQFVIELHLDPVHVHAGPRDLRTEAQRHAFLRLNLQSHVVWREPFDRGIAKQREWRLLELDHDFAAPRRQRLTGSQIERHARPAPVVDRELERHIGFGQRLGRDVGRAAIRLHGLSRDGAGAVLRAHDVAPGICGPERANRLQDLGLLRTYRSGAKTCRRLHRGQGEQLEQMVRYHITQGAS
jgi:hypothetical protein